jgi:sugar lactone lactonase YvrE
VDGAFYVGLLTGFPYPQGAASVYRVLPGQAPTIYAEGFTNIIDLAWTPDGTLYVLEIAHHGLASWNPIGALIRVEKDGSHHVVMTDGLFYPGGLVIHHGAAFISNCTLCAGTGEVLRVPLG